MSNELTTASEVSAVSATDKELLLDVNALEKLFILFLTRQSLTAPTRPSRRTRTGATSPAAYWRHWLTAGRPAEPPASACGPWPAAPHRTARPIPGPLRPPAGRQPGQVRRAATTS